MDMSVLAGSLPMPGSETADTMFAIVPVIIVCGAAKCVRSCDRRCA